MAFSHIKNWLFDLDNTLYSPHSNLFPQIHDRMAQFIEQRLQVDRARADELRAHYFHTYGTSLRGLMVEHRVPPRQFLDFVHDVDMGELQPDAALRDLLHRLPGRKLIFTNADRRYAGRVLERLGLTDIFEAIFDIEAAGYICKPDPAPYRALLHRYGLLAHETAFADDMPQNLKTAHDLGLTTLWLRHNAAWLRNKHAATADYPHCHYAYGDLPNLLAGLHAGLQPVKTGST